jgi:penicillin amidase
MKIFRRVLFLLLAVALIALAFGYRFLQKQAPKYEGTITAKEIKADTEVLFDEFGIPHIYADNAEDAYFALGYIHAQERLFQMELIRRLISGRMSELLGDELVETDKYFLTLGVREEAKRMARIRFSERETQIQKEGWAYLDGVNYFINTGNMPLEFTMLGIEKEPYTPEDMYSTIIYMAMAFTNGYKIDIVLEEVKKNYGAAYLEDWFMNYTGYDKNKEVAADSLELSKEALSFIDPFPDMVLPVWEGSNAWVVGPSKTKSGKVITANDTHIPFSQPSVWYEAHLEYPGFSFYGNYLAGVPFAPVGHNKDISWGLTIFPMDITDLYKERINPENPDQVWEDDHWAPMEVVQKTIKVKDGEGVSLTVKKTRHGPIMNEVMDGLGDAPVSLWWSLFELPNNSVGAFYDLAHASNIDTARKAAADNDILGLNIVYGDKDGNIAWWASGKIPKRPDHVNPTRFLDGASGKDEPLGYYDFSDNPQMENPESGILVSANHEPDPVNGQRYAGYYLPKGRFNRITELLSAKDDWTIEDMQKIHGDNTSAIHMMNAKKIVEVLENSGLSPGEMKLLDLLTGWEGDHALDGKAPIVYSKFLYYMTEVGLMDELGDVAFDEVLRSFSYRISIPTFINNPDSPWWDDISTADVKESQKDVFKRAFELTAEHLYAGLGDDVSQWNWGQVNTLTHVHPIGRKKPFDRIFNVGPFPTLGGNGVVNKQEHKLSPGHENIVKSGPALRILLDFDDIHHSLNVNPTGQSGNIMSPHYADQAEMYVDVKYHIQKTDRKEIEQNVRKLVFKGSKN